MLKDRGIRRGIEVFVKDLSSSDVYEKKAIVVNTYPPPSNWLVVQYDDGNIEHVEETRVTTMFEANRRKMGLL
jgi:hypothetical protein